MSETAKLSVTVADGNYELELPTYRRSDRTFHAEVRDVVGDVSVSFGLFGHETSLFLSPLSAHALAEALHAVANKAEGKPSDEPFTAISEPESVIEMMDDHRLADDPEDHKDRYLSEDPNLIPLS